VEREVANHALEYRPHGIGRRDGGCSRKQWLEQNFRVSVEMNRTSLGVDHVERKDAFAAVSFVALENVSFPVCCNSIGTCTAQVSIPKRKEACENGTHKREIHKKVFSPWMEFTY
jgi:hypothetical protein